MRIFGAGTHPQSLHGAESGTTRGLRRAACFSSFLLLRPLPALFTTRTGRRQRTAGALLRPWRTRRQLRRAGAPPTSRGLPPREPASPPPTRAASTFTPALQTGLLRNPASGEFVLTLIFWLQCARRSVSVTEGGRAEEESQRLTVLTPHAPFAGCSAIANEGCSARGCLRGVTTDGV